MKQRATLLAILLATVCYTAATAQTQVRSIMHDGLTRSFRVHLPPALDTCAHVPLVFNLHGRGSNGLQQEFYTQFSEVADTGYFVAVYPDAVNGEWDLNGSGVDDVGFIRTLIDTLHAELRIDRNKVFSCGMSMGGYMSYRLACELTDRIAAIASVTGLLATFPCNPSRPIAVLQMHGTDDPTVPYAGVAQTINAWVQRNNCPQQPFVEQLPDIDQTDSSTVTKSTYAPCTDNTEVILYTINGGEHTWPDAFVSIGITSGDINASNVIWNFFHHYQLSAFPAPPVCDSLHSSAPLRNVPAAFAVHYHAASKQLRIAAVTGSGFSLLLTDAVGRVHASFAADEQLAVPLAFYAPGIYCYSITGSNGRVQQGRFAVY